MKEFWATFYRHWATINSSLLVTLTDEQSVGPEPLPPKKKFCRKKVTSPFYASLYTQKTFRFE